ncbi:T9SS type A sorting domain-containing protein [Flavitalea flava]
MKSLIFSLALLFCGCTLYSQTWTELNPPDNLLNNTIFSTIAGKTGQVYAAGLFTNKNSNNIVATLINGAWKELGAGGGALNAGNSLYTLALDSMGNLYAGGAFTNASGNYYVAKWDGSTWSELGTGAAGLQATGQLFSLATDKLGNVYAGGELSDGSGKYYISKWDGHSWTQLGTGTHALNANGLIYSILPDPSGNIYVTGHFTDANGRYYVAKWNGSDWSIVGNGAGALNANSYINTLTIDAAGNIFAAGDFTDPSGQQYVAKWDGSAWTPVGTGSSALKANATINSIIIDAAGRLNAGGRFTNASGSYYLAQWSGSGWSEVTGTSPLWPVNNYITSLSPDPAGNIYAAGDFTDINGDHYVAELSGSGWSEPGLGGTKFPLQANPMQAVTVDTAGHVFVVLGDKDAGGNPIVEHWDGLSWKPLSNTIPGGYAYISGLAADSSGNVYAFGTFVAADGVAKWNGSGWTMLPSSAGQLTINSINHIATDKKGNVYISGSFTQNGNYLNMAKWDGAVWQAFASAEVYYFIVDTTGTIYAANYDFTNSGYNVLKITGNTVTRIGGTGPHQMNANTWVQAMVLDTAGNLYAGGGFADNNGHAYVAKWDGNSWNELGTGAGALGADGSITGLVFDNAGNLYSSGSLMQNSATYLGKWDGQAWSAISTGPMFWHQNTIGYLNRDARGIIYAGGQFKGSRDIGNYIYTYGSVTPPVVCDGKASVKLTANPTTVTPQSGPVEVSASLISGAGVNIRYVFSKDRNFDTPIQTPSSDSVITILISDLTAGTNIIYVKMQITDPCANFLTATDSVTIIKNAVTAVTDIDFPNTAIVAFPNPIGQFIFVTGLSSSKSYALTLHNNLGMAVRTLQIKGQTRASLPSFDLSSGIYWLEIYDNTRKRRIGQVTLLKKTQ